MKRYRLNTARDVVVDVDYYGGEKRRYILNLPGGYKLKDDGAHVRAYETMEALRIAAKNDVVECDCNPCEAKA